MKPVCRYGILKHHNNKVCLSNTMHIKPLAGTKSEKAILTKKVIVKITRWLTLVSNVIDLQKIKICISAKVTLPLKNRYPFKMTMITSVESNQNTTIISLKILKSFIIISTTVTFWPTWMNAGTAFVILQACMCLYLHSSVVRLRWSIVEEKITILVEQTWITWQLIQSKDGRFKSVLSGSFIAKF